MDKQFSLVVSMKTVAILGGGLPLFATLFCVVWSVIFNLEETTATHCKVANYLPSISAAIGQLPPQKYVWRICIAFHCVPRFVIAVMYYHFHTSLRIAATNIMYKILAAMCSVLHTIEVFALVVLTYISSTENHGVHETSFIVFMVSSLVYMLLSCSIFYWGRSYNGRIKSPLERRSLKYKVYLFLFNLTIFLTSVYIFFRHNAYCEPGVYTVFALFEYFTVFSNIAFHNTAALDFAEYTWQITPDTTHGSTLNGKRH